MRALAKTCACLRDSDADDEAHKSLGATTSAHCSALSNVDHDTIACPIAAHERSEDSKLKESTMLAFCHSEESSSIDSNCRRIVPVTASGFGEQHIGRAWSEWAAEEKHSLCC